MGSLYPPLPADLADRIGAVASIAGNRYRVRRIPLKAERYGAPLVLLLIEKIGPRKCCHFRGPAFLFVEGF
ncbi:hypothetical protein [Candidatus Manganitrophus noduliformans]|uniref:Uncharacterized protein n=1 Tax=Candidatus Manganitrophus noduliformans TaxID=2606439 RepID=A0A7X6DT54_9BACT|nr:hypothetical protein [Candidatus Manganitrophus noduliformans]NKE72890.1 hypothetical protein [Candidatus Manganitrophus noduliformans]